MGFFFRLNTLFSKNTKWVKYCIAQSAGVNRGQQINSCFKSPFLFDTPWLLWLSLIFLFKIIESEEWTEGLTSGQIEWTGNAAINLRGMAEENLIKFDFNHQVSDFMAIASSSTMTPWNITA